MAEHYSGKDIRTGRALSPKPPMPFIWHTAVNCLELPYGIVRHFPAGSYHAQVELWTGEAELELMRVAHSAWYTFKHLSKSEWKEPDLALFSSLHKRPELPPTRKWESIINSIYPLSAWVLRNIDAIRAGKRQRYYY